MRTRLAVRGLVTEVGILLPTTSASTVARPEERAVLPIVLLTERGALQGYLAHKIPPTPLGPP